MKTEYAPMILIQLIKKQLSNIQLSVLLINVVINADVVAFSSAECQLLLHLKTLSLKKSIKKLRKCVLSTLQSFRTKLDRIVK